MLSDKIVSYYLLCSVTGKLPHIVNRLDAGELAALLTSREKKQYLRPLRSSTECITTETVIGGRDAGHKLLIF